MSAPQELWNFRVCGQKSVVPYTPSSLTSLHQLREYLLNRFKGYPDVDEIWFHSSSQQCRSLKLGVATNARGNVGQHGHEEFHLQFVRSQPEVNLEQRTLEASQQGLRSLAELVDSYVARRPVSESNSQSFDAEPPRRPRRKSLKATSEPTPFEDVDKPGDQSSTVKPSRVTRSKGTSAGKALSRETPLEDATPHMPLTTPTEVQSVESDDEPIEQVLARTPRAPPTIANTVPPYCFNNATVRYVFSRLDGQSLTSPCWDPIDKNEPLWFPIDGVKQEVKDAIIDLLTQDGALLQTVRQQKQIVTYILAIDQEVCQERPHVLTLSGHRLTRVSDFFADPKATNLELTVRVELAFERPPNPPKRQCPLEDLVQHAKRMLKGILEYDPDEFVCVHLGDAWLHTPKLTDDKSGDEEDSDHDSDHAGDEAGSTAVDDVSDASNKGDDGNSDEGNADAADQEYIIRCTDALVGYFQKGKPQTAANLKLLSVPTRDFGDFCIGDNHDHCSEVQYSNRYHWLPPYAGSRSARDLAKRIKRRLSHKDPQLGAGLPFLPTFTLNVYHPALIKPPTGLQSFPKDGVHVAVRFAHHLDLTDVASKRIVKEDYRDIDFPMDVEIHVEPADDVAALKVELRKALKDTKGVEVTSGVLYDKPLKDTWAIQLWVMPQSPKLRKLFSYPNGRVGSTGQLHEFLDPAMVVKGDRRLYMEAHVVPV